MEEQPMSEARPEQESVVVPQAGRRTIPPTLFLGMGGTGTEVVARLKLHFDLRRQHEEDRRDYGLIRYFAVDTHPYEDLGDPARELRNIREYFYIGGFNEAEYVDRHYVQEREPDLVDWWDGRYRPEYRMVDEGAGANRQLGRLCLYRSCGAVTSQLRDILRDLNAAAPPGEEGEGAGRCELVLILGLAGGTGSGIFLDLSYIAWREALRAFGNTPPKVTAFMVLPFLHGVASQAISEWLKGKIVANGVAFLEELEHLLQHPGAMERLRFDTSSSADDRLAGQWHPFEYCYLIGNRVGKKGFRTLEEMYSYVSKSIHHLFMTPEQNYHRSVLDNIRAVVRRQRGDHHDKPTAFSTFGLATVEYPAEQILRYLTSVYGSRLVRDGFLYDHKSFEAAARDAVSGKKTGQAQGGRPRNLSEEFGGRQLSALRDELNRAISEAEAALPGAGGLVEAVRNRYTSLSDHAKALRGQYSQAADSACLQMSEIYRRVAGTALDEIGTRVRELIEREEGSFHWRRHLIEALEDHFQAILLETQGNIRTHEQTGEEADASSRDDQRHRGSEAYLLHCRRGRAEDAAQTFAQNLEKHALARMRVHRDRLCESFLLQLSSSADSLVVQAQQQHGRVAERRLPQSLLAEARKQIDELVSQATKLKSAFDDEQRLEPLQRVLAGGEQATMYVPDKVTPAALAKSKEVREALFAALESDEDVSATDKLMREVAAVTQMWHGDAGYEVKASAVLTNPDGCRAALRQAIVDRARQHEAFRAVARKQIEDFLSSEGQPLSDRVFSHLRGFASPCTNVDRDVLRERDREAINALWSLGSARDMRDRLRAGSSLLRGLGALADVGTTQISVVYTEHGFPLFAVRGLEDAYHTYNDLVWYQYHDPAVTPEYFPHIRAEWNTVRGVPYLGVRTIDRMRRRRLPETVLLFLTGLIIDEMLQSSEGASKIGSVLQHDPIRLGDRLPLRGFVFRDREQNGKYCAYLLRKYGSGTRVVFEPGELVPLAHSRAQSLSRFERIEASAHAVMRECLIAVAEAMGGEEQFKDVLAKDWVPRLRDVYGESRGQPEEDIAALSDMYTSLCEYVGPDRLSPQAAVPPDQFA